MSEELERCPFCRSSIVGAHVNDFHLHEVGCGACGCSGPAEASEAEAIAAWNRRAPAQPEPAAPTFTQEQFDEAEAKGKALSERLKAQDAAWPEAAPTVVEPPEPVAWMWRNTKTGARGVYFEDPARFFDFGAWKDDYEWTPMVAATPPRASLTDADIDEIAATNLGDYEDGKWHLVFARAVIAASGGPRNE